MAVHADDALILRRHPYGESSLVVQALTRDSGRVHLLAKGAYRPKSGYCGVLDLFDTLRLGWSGGERGGLAVLREARILERRAGLPRELDRYRPALAILELAEWVTRPGAAEPPLFGLVERALDELAGGETPSPWVVPAFDLRVLSVAGLEPALLRCASCGGPAPPTPLDPSRAPFSAGAGGRLCGPCAQAARGAGKRVGTLPVEVLEGADELLRSGGLDPARARAVGDAVVDFAQRFLEYHLEAQPRTRDAPRPALSP